MAAETGFSEAEQHQIQTNLIDKLKSDPGAKDAFCKCWPCAKEVLNLIAKIPHLPAVVVNVILGIIKAGDVAQGTVCSK